MDVWLAGLGVVGALALHAFWTVWWAATMTSRVRTLEREVAQHNGAGLGERMAKLEGIMHEIRGQLQNLVNSTWRPGAAE